MQLTKQKPGYKHTVVGVIPVDWEVKHLKEISPSQTVGLVINPSTYYCPSGTVPLLVGSNVKENSIDWEAANKITEEGNRQIPASQLYAGDLVMVRVGEPGVTAVVPKELEGANCASMMIIRRSRRFNSTWLCWTLNSKLGRSQVQNVQYGTAQKQFNISDAINFKYPVPPLREQEAIAAALSDADGLIESLEKVIAKKRQIKHGTMQELLTGKRRLPGFRGEWETKCIADIADCLDYLRIPLNDSQRAKMKGDYPYCGANGVLDYINQYCVDDSVILIAEDGGYFDEYMTRPIAYRMSGRFWVNNHAHILKTKPAYDQDFLYYSLVHKNILSFLASGTRAKLNKSELSKISVNQPCTKDEQAHIAMILSDMDAEIAALEAKLTKARRVKQGMMQELLTGRTRLI
jgi:type I restriction enzyme S subunit